MSAPMRMSRAMTREERSFSDRHPILTPMGLGLAMTHQERPRPVPHYVSAYADTPGRDDRETTLLRQIPAIWCQATPAHGSCSAAHMARTTDAQSPGSVCRNNRAAG